ncbi:MAG: glycosyltransferase family 25 protein [Acetobacter orientalis]|uniref:glycosyltransferase family 25 protein n=1 Tax=Acetobacter orientalis TaxID=146474 RepID=UPI0039E9389C
MEIRLINLDRSVDRLKRFRNHNMTHNNINRVSAIDGTKIDRLELIEGELLDPSLIYTDGAIGCALSHIIQWNYAVENEVPITIIEDDAILSKNFSEETERLIGTLNDDWDIVFWAYNMDSYISLQMPGGLGGCNLTFDQSTQEKPEALFSEKISSQLYKLQSFFGMAAYSVSPRGAEKILKFCLPLRPMLQVYPVLGKTLQNTGIDNMVCKILPHIKSFAAYPPLAVPENNTEISTVQLIGNEKKNNSSSGIDYGAIDSSQLILDSLSMSGFSRGSGILIHFVLTTESGGRAFGFSHYMAIKSAFSANPSCQIILWCTTIGSGPYWEAIKAFAQIIILPSPVSIFGNTINHAAHKSDIIRLAVMRTLGGVYLDLDTITLRSYEMLLNSTVVMARELQSSSAGVAPNKLGNAVIIGPANAEFFNIWWETYKTFDCRHWNQHSVLVPAIIANQRPELITVLSPEAFFVPTWDHEGLIALFERNMTFPNAFCHHLWESQAWQFISKINEKSVFYQETTYNMACRKYLSTDDLKKLAYLHREHGVFSGISNDENIETTVRQELFQTIYKNSVWGNGQGRPYSGPGSDPERVPEYINFLSQYIRHYDIHTVTDIGCGDFRIGSEVASINESVLFTGADIVQEIILQNKKYYKHLKNCDFICLDIVTSEPKPTQFAIVREVFQHLSNESILASLQHLKSFKHVLICNNITDTGDKINAQHADSADIRKGGLDFSLPPFNVKVELLARLPIRGRPGYLEIVRLINE